MSEDVGNAFMRRFGFLGPVASQAIIDLQSPYLEFQRLGGVIPLQHRVGVCFLAQHNAYLQMFSFNYLLPRSIFLLK